MIPENNYSRIKVNLLLNIETGCSSYWLKHLMSQQVCWQCFCVWRLVPNNSGQVSGYETPPWFEKHSSRLNFSRHDICTTNVCAFRVCHVTPIIRNEQHPFPLRGWYNHEGDWKSFHSLQNVEVFTASQDQWVAFIAVQGQVSFELNEEGLFPACLLHLQRKYIPLSLQRQRTCICNYLNNLHMCIFVHIYIRPLVSVRQWSPSSCK